MSERVLKTLACRGLRVGPSKWLTCKVFFMVFCCAETCGAPGNNCRWQLMSSRKIRLKSKVDSAKNLIYSTAGVVYKLHAGWSINRTPGEFMNCGLYIKCKGLLCGNPTEGRKFKTKFSGRQAVYTVCSLIVTYR